MPDRQWPDPAWAKWPDERLLDLRLCDLGLAIEGSLLQPRVAELYQELEQRGFVFRPHFWFSSEWFCPDGIPGVAVPFYLAHPRLMQLERTQTGEVEGGARQECMRLLRHEVGHAIDHAYGLNRRRRWQQVFGKSSRPYPSFYSPRPTSRRYVVHLEDSYAQSHPDEDFAETFAVWLTPRSHWYVRYRNWPALRKIEYVDELMRQIARRKPKVVSRARVEQVSQDRRTLRQYYQERSSQFGISSPEVYDEDLRRLFSDRKEHARNKSAATFLREIEDDLQRLVSSWSSEYRGNLQLAYKDMIKRCQILKLRVAAPEDRLKVDFAIVLTLHAMNYLHRGRLCILM